MAGIFDGWSLANSRAIPQYQGSTIPELNKVADTLEQRYDVGRQQSDLLDQMIKTSTSAQVDQPMLTSLKSQYRDKVNQYSEQGNYEDMWRNVAMDARDFAGHVKNIQANQQAIQGYTADLNKRVSEGKLDPAVARARQLQMNDTYSGLKMDPETGQLTNFFSGTATVPSIDVPEKVNKWLQDSHAIERGWKVEKPTPDGDWYITNGTDRKKLPWSMIKPVIDSGIALDPEVKAWLGQEHELAPYYQGITSKVTPDQVQQLMQQSPQLGAMIKQKIDQGLAPTAALHAVLGDSRVSQHINEIYNYARKGVVDEEKTDYAQRMTPLMEERLKKQAEHTMFSVPFTDVSPGTTISSVKDFDSERGKAFNEADTLAKQLGALRNAPNVTEHDGRMFRREADGTTTDITEDANKLRSGIKAATDRVNQYDMIKKAAADATNYHPEQTSREVRSDAKAQAEQYRTERLKAASQVTQVGPRGIGTQVTGTRIPTADEVQQINQKASEIEKEYREVHHPAYSDFTKELIKRLQPQGEGNKLWIANDDKMKKSLNDFADAAISGIGLKQGLVSLQVGSGKNAGQDLTADDYDQLQGKMDVVGVYNDARTGETKVVMRANQDIKGKKVKGENMIVTMKDVGGVDNWMKANNSPQEYRNFAMDRVLKSNLNNVASTMNYPITDDKGVSHGNVQITRKKGSNQGPGNFSIRVATPSGWKQVSVDSYEGLIEKLQDIEDVYNGRNNTNR